MFQVQDQENYLTVIGKISKYDNDGNEITNETLGSGGSRRDDGTISKMAENLRIQEGDSDSNNDEPEGERTPDGAEAEVLMLALGIAAGVVAAIVVVKAAPRAKSWWLESALPGLRVKWSQFTRRKRRDPEPAARELAAPIAIEPVEISTEISVMTRDERSVMSSVEAQHRYLAMMMAAAFAAEQFRALQDARIEYPEKLLELKRAVAELSTQEAADTANRMLEADGSLLDEMSQAVFVQMFGGGKTADGGYLPIQRERLEVAMRFSLGEG